jgi:peptide chain release factor 2
VSACKRLGGIFELDKKHERIQTIKHELDQPHTWSDIERSQKLSQELAKLEKTVTWVDNLHAKLEDLPEIIEMAAQESDQEMIKSLKQEAQSLQRYVERLEFQRMFSGDMDISNAYLTIQAGSGGTEAQDWAEMLMRMYLRWAERKGFSTEIMELSPGEVAGIKSVTVRVEGDYVFGWLRSESGVHRLVRKSPFDSGHRRHTSFASLFVSPEIEDNVEIDIDPSQLRIDTYRAQGAGGQHVNTTDSAVRITHEPTGIIVQCQNNRSQHKNREQAMRQLRSRLYEIELEKKYQEKRAKEGSKSNITWGSQIRSYVLDACRVKDLRTGVEIHNPEWVLDGNLDGFIEATLKQQGGDSD